MKDYPNYNVRALIWLCFVLIAGNFCTDIQAQDPTTITSSATLLMSFKLEMVSGDMQITCPDSILRDSLKVKVVGKNGVPIEGAQIKFMVAQQPPGSSAGTFSPVMVNTNQNGEAATSYTCGNGGGRYILHAIAEDPEVQEGTPQIFTLNAISVDLVAEESTSGAGDHLTECMEGRVVTFTGTLPPDYPINAGNPISYVLHIVKPDGSEETISGTGITRTLDATAVMPEVPAGDTDHFYTAKCFMTLSASGFSCRSDTLNIDVYELWIDYVRFVESDGTQRDWKMVVNRDAEYKAIASDDTKEWEWDMPPGKWRNNGGNGRSSEPGDDGEKIWIPISDLHGGGVGLRAKNDWFGDTYGTVRATCRDGDDNEFSIKSTDQTPSMKVKVFYVKNRNIFDQLPTTDEPPLWFLYWRQGVVLDGLTGSRYDQSADFGYWSPGTGLVMGPLGAGQNGPKQTLLDLNGVPFTMTGEGLHLLCAAETVTHELHHSTIYNIFPFGGGPGPTRSNHADNDGLPDFAENNPNSIFFPQSLPDNNDSFNFNYPPASGYDYSDNEVQCRVLERHSVRPFFPNKDWSQSRFNPLWTN